MDLPELLRFDSGEPVQAAAQWESRRAEVFRHIVPLVYGEFRPAPAQTRGIELHSAVLAQFGGARLKTYRVEADHKQAFLMQVFVPAGGGPMPVVISADGCWHYATDQVLHELMRRNCAFAQFNRVEVAADQYPQVSPTPSAGSVPQGPAAIASWAWGYHRAVDVLEALDFVNPKAIAVVGHSRGGKAALLAGATDARIALTCANNSGLGGAGSFRALGAGAETIAELMHKFPHWLNPALASFAGREHEMPCDQHFLKALIAPRALLTTEALDDLWANPAGTWQTHLAAQKVYALLGAGQKIACMFREGGHTHSYEDWCAMLDFVDALWRDGQ